MNDAPWYVISGGPCAGKTTTIIELEKRGHPVILEPARVVIERGLALGKTLDEVRSPVEKFLEDVVEEAIAQERVAHKHVTQFLDRSVVDSVAYYRLCNVPVTKLLEDAAKGARYKKLFLLDLVDFKNDEARNETPEVARHIHELIEQAYRDFAFEIVKVPVLSVEARADMILANL
ncbi:MAG: hypothetical protein RIQ56_48 [Candidatus Parcubacteria bacterium]